MFHYNIHCVALTGVENRTFIQFIKVESWMCLALRTIIGLFAGKDHYKRSTMKNFGYSDNTSPRKKSTI